MHLYVWHHKKSLNIPVNVCLAYISHGTTHGHSMRGCFTNGYSINSYMWLIEDQLHEWLFCTFNEYIATDKLDIYNKNQLLTYKI